MQSVVLNVADVREVNAQLEVGAVTEVVTVETETVAPATVGGEVAGLVRGEQLRELPLNGRNFLQLTQQMPRNACDGPDFFSTDLAIYKSFPFKDRFNVQLRLEVFNLFNTVNLIGWSADLDFNPAVTLDSPRNEATVVTGTGEPASTFGLATQARDARQFQLGVKLTF